MPARSFFSCSELIFNTPYPMLVGPRSSYSSTCLRRSTMPFMLSFGQCPGMLPRSLSATDFGPSSSYAYINSS